MREAHPWQATPEVAARINALAGEYRALVSATLQPLVAEHYPDLLQSAAGEYRKMLELSAKMTLVGRAQMRKIIAMG